MRLIDADVLIKHLKEEIDECGKEDIGARPIAYGTILGLKSGIAFAEAMPTVDIKTEVAREIFAEIEFDIANLDFDREETRAIAIEGVIAELKNKHIGGVGE